MSLFNNLAFVRDEIKDIPNLEKRPDGGIESFDSRALQAISLALKEKEIFTFGLLQWVCIGLAYFLWARMLDWIPDEVWRTAANSEGGSIVDVVLLAWSFVCVGLAAYPIGVLTGCMGATHFLHEQGKQSTVAACLRLVIPQSWSLWAFHWIDGWITVMQIFDRLPKKNDRRSAVDKAKSEALYYAWKLGVSGVLPSIVTGNNLVVSGKNSVLFVKDNFMEVAKLRAGYSALCWIIGILTYVAAILLFAVVEIVPEGKEIHGYIYEFYMWAGLPMLAATSVVMLILRPIYVLALCDLYSDHLKNNNVEIEISDEPSRSLSAFVAFLCLCLITASVYLYRVELGIVEALSTPYEQAQNKEAKNGGLGGGEGLDNYEDFLERTLEAE